jgi:hypothetical protein
VTDVFPPRAALRLASRNLRKALKSGRVPVRVGCDEACSAVVELRITRKLAKRLKLKRKVVIARARGAVPAGRVVSVRPKLTKAVRRALRKRTSLPFTIRATLTDALGNRATLSRKASLKLARPRRGARPSSAR